MEENPNPFDLFSIKLCVLNSKIISFLSISHSETLSLGEAPRYIVQVFFFLRENFFSYILLSSFILSWSFSFCYPFSFYQQQQHPYLYYFGFIYSSIFNQIQYSHLTPRQQWNVSAAAPPHHRQPPLNELKNDQKIFRPPALSIFTFRLNFFANDTKMN